MHRTNTLGPLLAAVLLAGLATAANPPATEPKVWGDFEHLTDLTREQREKLRQIWDTSREKIRQIEQQADADRIAVLNPQQKAALNKIREDKAEADRLRARERAAKTKQERDELQKRIKELEEQLEKQKPKR